MPYGWLELTSGGLSCLPHFSSFSIVNSLPVSLFYNILMALVRHLSLHRFLRVLFLCPSPFSNDGSQDVEHIQHILRTSDGSRTGLRNWKYSANMTSKDSALIKLPPVTTDLKRTLH